MPAPQLAVADAIQEAPATCAALGEMAAAHRGEVGAGSGHHITRQWEPAAGTWCYQTHIAAPDQPPAQLDRLADIFFNAAAMPSQPWYPQFLGGEVAVLESPPAGGIDRHQLTLGQFDLGLPNPRYYRQLVSFAKPDAATAIIIARSVTDGPPLPAHARLAYTLAPNGEVLHWENGRLHWHHICCTHGAGVLPGRLDRWLINLLRLTGLDGAERKTYRQEAEQWRDWLTGPLRGRPA
jgi:hypothetical protein